MASEDKSATCPAEWYYPEALRAAEEQRIAARRGIFGASTLEAAKTVTCSDPLARGPHTHRVLPKNAMGLALSGGGIRSATFCLGVAQALAALRVLRRVDFLSTVSGGGYFGGFLGAWINRAREGTPEEPSGFASAVLRVKKFCRLHPQVPKKPPTLEEFEKLERGLQDGLDPRVAWLRENGRYLAPNGSGDYWNAFASLLRNWMAVQVVLIAFALMLGAAWILVADGGVLELCTVPDKVVSLLGWVSSILPDWVHRGWGALSGDIAALAGIVWWIVPGPVRVLLDVSSLLNGGWQNVVGFGHGLLVMLRTQGGKPWPPAIDGAIAWHWSPAIGLVVLALVPALCWGVAFWFPWSTPEQRNKMTHSLSTWLLVTTGILLVVLVDSAGGSLYASWAGIAAKVAEWKKTSGGAAGVVVLLGRYAFRLLQTAATAKQRPAAWTSYVAGVAAFVVGGAWVCGTQTLACVLAVNWQWAGLLVPAGFTALFSRNRTFVNLSSQAALYSARLTRAYLGASNPDRTGDGKSDVTETLPRDVIEFADYSPDEAGGPLHLINVTVNETIAGKSNIEQHDRKGFNLAVGPSGMSAAASHHALWGNGRTQLVPIPRSGGGFHCFGETTSTPEALHVGRWIGISGAAFTTGLGARTSVALSVLLGFFNVRIGHWWDSNVRPRTRLRNVIEKATRARRAAMSLIFPVQAQLLSEFFGRFYGSARRYWYLSDGGHFENTAGYELIRRRLPVIVICDDGADSERALDDFGNLVRKARTDFQTEITVLDERALGDVDPELPGVFGPLAALRLDPGSGLAPRRAALAQVEYRLTGEQGWIVLLKPNLTGKEPADVVNYWRCHDDFPQQTTLDQFYDEAQWESYRALGEDLARRVFGSEPVRRLLGLRPDDVEPIWPSAARATTLSSPVG
jgi:hypothetical protein